MRRGNAWRTTLLLSAVWLAIAVQPAGAQDSVSVDEGSELVAAETLSNSQGVVKTLNGLTGDIGLQAGGLVSIAPSGNDLTISASIPVPLVLVGDVSNGSGVITVTNTAAGAPGLFTTGGAAGSALGGGTGMVSIGGTGGTGGATTPGGVGLVGFGGSASASSGGTGGSLIGGVSTAGSGGDGAFAVGALGVGTGRKGGRGIVAIPGGGAGGATAGLAGEFLGDVEISGNLSKGGGSFKIDHPLDPENRYLSHSFVESPDMMNIYNGNVVTDGTGTAVVTLPAWFQTLNRDFRYQLTVVGTFAQAIVGSKVQSNRFTIRTSLPNVEVSWQVTGIRQDAYANLHRIPVEQSKPDGERGFYLHPDAFGQPEERGVAWVRSSQALRELMTGQGTVADEPQAEEEPLGR